jgi:hypothetical protein
VSGRGGAARAAGAEEEGALPPPLLLLLLPPMPPPPLLLLPCSPLLPLLPLLPLPPPPLTPEPAVCAAGRGQHLHGERVDIERPQELADVQPAKLQHEERVAIAVDLGFGRIVASEIEAPNMLVNLV